MPWALRADCDDIAGLVHLIERREHKYPGTYRCRALAGLDTALEGPRHELVPTAEEFLPAGARAEHELWPAVLVFLIATLLVEQALAWRFRLVGRPRARSARAELVRT